MKVYLTIKVLQPVDFFSEGTGYRASPGDLVSVNSRSHRHPAGISAEAAVRMVQAEEAELVGWGELGNDGAWREMGDENGGLKE